MASAANGGYDCTFVEELPEDFACVLCSLALKDPVQFENCGHRLCKYCFNQLKYHACNRNIDLLCPIDREIIDENKVFNDKGIARKILNSKVYCGGKEEGCDWSDELRHLEAHEGSCLILNPQPAAVQDVNDLRSKLQELNISVKKKNQDLDESRKDIEELKERCKSLEENVQQLTESNKTLQDIVQQMTEVNETLTNTVQQLTQNNKTLKENNQHLTESHKRLETTVNKLVEKNQDSENTIQELLGRIKKNEYTVVQLNESNISAIDRHAALENTMQLIENRLEVRERIDPYIYQWVVDYDKLKDCNQYSEQFYLGSLPFCFRMKANIFDEKLMLRVRRCRGKNDKADVQIISNFSEILCDFYLVGATGRVHSRNSNLPNDIESVNIEAGSDENHYYYGYDTFLITDNWDRWLNKNSLHIFCKMKYSKEN